jgi:putative flippase GtrA
MFLRYLGVSLLALAIDIGVLAFLSQGLEWSYTLSAVIAYLVGAVLHYLLSRHQVFGGGWLRGNPSLEMAAFLASGACGAAVTAVIVGGLSAGLDVPLSVAKGVAVGVSFFVVYLLRSRLVFRIVAN